MTTIRCPHCGTLNHADDFGYPRCGQCHEDLVRCGYCRHFDRDACTHPRFCERFTPDLEAAKSCPGFRSRFEAREAGVFAQLPAPLWVVFLLTLIVGCLTAAAWFIDPYGRYFFGNPLDLQANVPAVVTTNQPFTVTLRITNLLENARSTRIYIEIGEEYVNAAIPGPAFPPPRKVTYSSNRFVLEYGPLGRGAVLPVRLQFIQHKLGEAKFVARVYAPGNHLSHEVNTTIFALGGPLDESRGGRVQ